MGFFIAGQFVIQTMSQSSAMWGMGFTLLSVPTCFVGIILLAFALGKPQESTSMTMVMQNITNPASIKVPYLEQSSQSDAQSYGLLIISLGFLSGFGSIVFGIIAIVSSMGSGLGGSGGSCGDFCENTWNLTKYSCIGGILLVIGGLIVVARPWSWFGNQAKVVLIPANESNQSNQEDLSSLTVLQLKEKLKEKGLPVSGKKEDLLVRLKTGEEVEEVQEVEKYIHNCSNCQQSLKIPVGYEGRIRCPSCDTPSTL